MKNDKDYDDMLESANDEPYSLIDIANKKIKEQQEEKTEANCYSFFKPLINTIKIYIENNIREDNERQKLINEMPRLPTRPL